MKTIFEISKAGKRAVTFAPISVPKYNFDSSVLREDLTLPAVAEVDLVRHYTALSKRAFGVDDGFYPLGSCTMKYNPKINEEVASFEEFTGVHPRQNVKDVQGSLKLISILSSYLCEITGMDGVTLQPCAGAHGEYTGLQLIKKYHEMRGDLKRNKIIVPDSAHGTNPASAAMAGFEIIAVKSDENKGVDLDELEKVVGDDTAALMLTNPTTLGLFERNIEKIDKIVHNAGGLLYYDGANLNAVMGMVRPGDMGFDVVHLNLHKTFSTPHGGGGPGSGPVGCKKALVDYLPKPVVTNVNGKYEFVDPANSIGKVTAFYGNFLVFVKAFAYIVALGGEGLKDASQTAVLNANYLKARIQDLYPTEEGRHCMHEFVVSLEELKEKTGVSAMDIAKAMIDGKMHPPTMYFPMIVHEALMFEPTETENKDTLDAAADLLRELYDKSFTAPEELHASPRFALIKRPDEVKAARNPILRG